MANSNIDNPQRTPKLFGPKDSENIIGMRVKPTELEEYMTIMVTKKAYILSPMNMNNSRAASWATFATNR